MEFNIVYVVSERPAVGLSGPMVDLGGLSGLPSPIAEWPCSFPDLFLRFSMALSLVFQNIEISRKDIIFPRIGFLCIFLCERKFYF